MDKKEYFYTDGRQTLTRTTDLPLLYSIPKPPDNSASVSYIRNGIEIIRSINPEEITYDNCAIMDDKTRVIAERYIITITIKK